MYTAGGGAVVDDDENDEGKKCSVDVDGLMDWDGLIE